MVVHPDFPGLEVKVIAGDDEIPCKEYRLGDDKSESGTPVRYIEAKSGELFCVYVHVPASCYFNMTFRPRSRSMERLWRGDGSEKILVAQVVKRFTFMVP
jgi:hypothetical protein